jgi:hypothetical protein
MTKSAETSLSFLRLNGCHELYEPLAAARPDDNLCAAFGKQPCCGFADALEAPVMATTRPSLVPMISVLRSRLVCV